MVVPSGPTVARQMDLYVSFRHLLDQLPQAQALLELTRISVHLQHNTADYCLGCASCPFEETCRREQWYQCDGPRMNCLVMRLRSDGLCTDSVWLGSCPSSFKSSPLNHLSLPVFTIGAARMPGGTQGKSCTRISGAEEKS
jgi:hypothetical protein